VVPIVADIARPDDVRAAFTQVEQRFGQVDVLVNAAAVARLTLVEDASDEDIDYVFRTNLFGPVHTARAVVPLMRRAGGGLIINISSEATTDAMPYNTLYGVSKAGVNALTSMLGRELREANIRVCLCVLGRTSGTAFSDNYSPAQWAVAKAQAEKEGYYARVAGTVAMAPDEVAETLVFMATRPAHQTLTVVHVRASR
jgi:NAD(P)-dependent dehydrogenase (short-subunit alcohol dehydrogenase family)